jgi:hypothetical protein
MTAIKLQLGEGWEKNRMLISKEFISINIDFLPENIISLSS